MNVKIKIWHWLVLGVLSMVWGTSYILMKKGLESFSSGQVGALRITITYFCLLPTALRNRKYISRNNILSFVIIGLFGSVFPAFLFPLAETKISSSLAGMLNSLSPVFTLVIGILFYNRKWTGTQIAGIILGLIGATGLLYSGSVTINLYGILVVLSSIMSGLSSNEVCKVKAINGFRITALSFFVSSPPAIVYLFLSDMSEPMQSDNWIRNLCYIGILAVLGTATALAIFYVLIRDTSPVFGSMVTYLIPIVATLWGLADNEIFSPSMILSLTFILAGVFIINSPGLLTEKKLSADE